MRFSLALLPFITAAVALPVSQPVARAPADSLINLPELGTILGGLPQLDVSEVIAELNTTLHGALPTLPPTVIAQIQSVLDRIQDGAHLTGDHSINADFASKAAGFNWHHGGEGHGEGGMGGMGGDSDIPPWLLDLLYKLIELLGQVGGGPVHGPPGGPSPPIGTPTTPPTDAPIPTDSPTDVPFPPTVSTELPVPTDGTVTIPTIELPTDELPTDPLPTDEPTVPVPTDLPTDTESTEDPSSTVAPVPTSTFPTIPPPGETDIDTIDEGATGTVTGSASSTGTALGEQESDLPEGI